MSHRCAGNYLLATIAEDIYHRLEPALEMIILSQGQALDVTSGSEGWVYFPHQALVSLSLQLAEGSTTAISWIGREGAVGLLPFLAAQPDVTDCRVMITGSASQVRVEALQVEWNRNRDLQELFLRYFQAQMLQVARWSACARLHPPEERLASWLLWVQACVGSRRFVLTQKLWSEILGDYHPGIDAVVERLFRAGVLDYNQGEVTILDPQGLTAIACGCHRAIRDNFQRLLKITPDLS